jgi:hypothetical protein
MVAEQDDSAFYFIEPTRGAFAAPLRAAEISGFAGGK